MSAQQLKGKVSEAAVTACTLKGTQRNVKWQRLNFRFGICLQNTEIILFVYVCTCCNRKSTFFVVVCIDKSQVTSKFHNNFQKTPVKPLMPNDTYRGRTAPLTSKVSFYIFIQQIQAKNILNMLYTLRFLFFKMQFVS